MEDELAKLLARASGVAGRAPITLDDVQADLAAGAPTNEDGTVNLLHFAAWLLATTDGGGTS